MRINNAMLGGDGVAEGMIQVRQTREFPSAASIDAMVYLATAITRLAKARGEVFQFRQIQAHEVILLFRYDHHFILAGELRDRQLTRYELRECPLSQADVSKA